MQDRRSRSCGSILRLSALTSDPSGVSKWGNPHICRKSRRSVGLVHVDPQRFRPSGVRVARARAVRVGSSGSHSSVRGSAARLHQPSATRLAATGFAVAAVLIWGYGVWPRFSRCAGHNAITAGRWPRPRRSRSATLEAISIVQLVTLVGRRQDVRVPAGVVTFA
jgi:hypothetical protein